MQLAPMLNAFSYTPVGRSQHYTTPGWTQLVPAQNVEPDQIDDYKVNVPHQPEACRGFSLQHVQAVLPTCQVRGNVMSLSRLASSRLSSTRSGAANVDCFQKPPQAWTVLPMAYITMSAAIEHPWLPGPDLKGSVFSMP